MWRVGYDSPVQVLCRAPCFARNLSSVSWGAEPFRTPWTALLTAGQKPLVLVFPVCLVAPSAPPSGGTGTAASSSCKFGWSDPGREQATAYLDGDGDHLVGQVLVQQADGRRQELQRAGVCSVGIDAIQKLKVHDEDVPLLQEARGHVSQSVSARDSPECGPEGATSPSAAQSF